jgi:RNA polymerase sigma-70 factor (ECF subfamily)
VPYALNISDLSSTANGESAADVDRRIVAAAQQGNRAALESLLRGHYDRCYAVCRRLLGDEQDALDATQEAMTAIARGIATFDGRSAFSTWAYRVATNAALDELRRRRRRPVLDAAAVSRTATDPLANLSDLGRPVDIGEQVTARIALDQALQQVSDEHRTAVVLRDVMDLEYAEIAEVLRVPIGTVRSRIARGRAALARTLETEPPPAVAEVQRNQNAGDGVQSGESRQ